MLANPELTLIKPFQTKLPSKVDKQLEQLDLKLIHEVLGFTSSSKYSSFNNLHDHLKNCGQWVYKKSYCKHCEKVGNEALLKVKKVQQFCQVRYCKNPKCISHRFALQLEKLKSIPRLKKLNNLWHFVIGFEKIKLSEFANKKKQYDNVLNIYFNKLRKAGIKIQALKVADISKGQDGNKPNWDKKYYLHYHFIAIPFKTSDVRQIMISMQNIRKSMIYKQKIKVPFNLKVFGLKKKSALFSYLSLRSVGVYKAVEEKEKNYNLDNVRKLSELLEAKKFMFLKDIMSEKFYFENFYNKRHISFIGDNYQCQGCKTEFPLKHVTIDAKGHKSCPKCGCEEVWRCLPKGSIIMDNVLHDKLLCCKIHGELQRNEIRIEFEPINEDIPPDIVRNGYEKANFDVVSLVPTRESWSKSAKKTLKKYGYGGIINEN